MVNSGSWNKYSTELKEDMKGTALFYVVLHAHRFSPEPTKYRKKPADPYNYFAMIIQGAFIQTWRKDKTYKDMLADCNKIVGDYKPPL